MDQTLLLNATYEPLKVVHWQRAITLWAQGKVEIVEEHDREVRSVKFSFRLPAVVRLLHYIRLRKRPMVQFTRANIYQRDNFQCQYCAESFERRIDELTFDHVVPVANGGTKGWENIVTACARCNRRKGARTPDEAGMKLLRQPRRPLVMMPAAKLSSGLIGAKTPETWRSYLYWNAELSTS